jgi:RNA-dependent RNA polymerase
LHFSVILDALHCQLQSHPPWGQVREQAAWFWSAPPGGPTAQDVRDWMGDFSAIRCVAKHTARMGQCFSSTVDTLKLQVRACSGHPAPYFKNDH